MEQRNEPLVQPLGWFVPVGGGWPLTILSGNGKRAKADVSEQLFSDRQDALALPVSRIVELLYARRTTFQDWHGFPR